MLYSMTYSDECRRPWVAIPVTFLTLPRSMIRYWSKSELDAVHAFPPKPQQAGGSTTMHQPPTSNHKINKRSEGTIFVFLNKGLGQTVNWSKSFHTCVLLQNYFTKEEAKLTGVEKGIRGLHLIAIYRIYLQSWQVVI